MKKNYGSGGIRTHASEETGALNQRLRPLGHATWILNTQSSQLEKAASDLLSLFTKNFLVLDILQETDIKKNLLSEVGFEPTPSYEDQKSLYSTQSWEQGSVPWVWRLRPLGHPDRIKRFWEILSIYLLLICLFNAMNKIWPKKI